ncbi:(2Fe-2S)-binding protein [Epibacterium ulvae]|uniref:(2Fe-2S)-binding protein n=1 Tax=Epibacterium ulvae TaxID=1156985 RepID=UPI001BFC518F|nr:(2Fe-2S)-binding protein [Epibacterium ulvae]MBT8154185.1 (2Fe-2S)-binding protein [Epibacterium ulvae]
MVTIGGIRSTGLSAALGIAERVAKAFSGQFVPPAGVTWPTMAMMAEKGTRDWALPGNDGIVCHCEKVTRREIEMALEGPLGATNLAGLKRRTRATMGRCQGFYCSGEIEKLTGFTCPEEAKT